jgi:dihydrodiol dehydrogenase / D-xylose 1-dehydrogenase (NADP)
VKEFPLPKSKNPIKFINSQGLRYEAEETRRCIRAGLLESDSVTHAESVLIAEIEDELRRQVGVHYPEDDQEF